MGGQPDPEGFPEEDLVIKPTPKPEPLVDAFTFARMLINRGAQATLAAHRAEFLLDPRD